jgi:serine/threonine protein kinase
LGAAFSILADVAVGMTYLHTLGFIHRDLKPGNLLVFRPFRIKICDFGIAKQVSSNTNTVTIGIGSPLFMAPEAIFTEYSGKFDLWSFGMVSYELLLHNKTSQFFQISGTDHQPTPEYERRFKKEVGKRGLGELRRYEEAKGMAIAVFNFFGTDWLAQCLDWEPTNRPEFLDLVKILCERDEAKIERDEIGKRILAEEEMK